MNTSEQFGFMPMGLSWDGGRRVATVVAFMVALTLIAIPGMANASESPISVIVEAAAGEVTAAQAAVEAAGGTVGQNLDIINSFEATVSFDDFASLTALDVVVSLTPNSSVQLLGWDTSPGHLRNDVGTVVGKVLDADRFWNAGYTGEGIDIALIDSGVLPVEGLRFEDKIVYGPDLSFESQSPTLANLDTYGHGTHMAGIIAGNDLSSQYLSSQSTKRGFVGVAPMSRIVSVKVADAGGNTDVSQVIAAIDWVVEHRNTDGLNIRVLNLSFGTDATQSYLLDPLAHAAEVAWEHGVVVVVAAGNDGNSAVLRNPALNPFVIAVGSADPNGSARTADDSFSDFSNCGTTARHVDILAPGQSIISLRAPGSAADVDFPTARVSDQLFVGSGTSQAAAFVSGAAALLLSQRPDLTPDQVKALLTDSAVPMSGVSTLCQGAGLINLTDVVTAPTPLFATQTFASSTGLGSLEGARGSMHVTMDGVLLIGEQDIFGNTWTGSSWSGSSWSGSSWAGSSWSGSSWSGSSWSGSSWSGSSWSANVWTGSSWSGSSWSGSSWSGSSWSASGWLSSGHA
ncbi:MAG: S8 family serine peptidase [Acidimicrobiia bacterium]|nr:S8 family serine peptidase [Acidimicrobiia bacterium]NNF65020.1 S8 family serine peptidase [Acidimicrobiia bacterium]